MKTMRERIAKELHRIDCELDAPDEEDPALYAEWWDGEANRGDYRARADRILALLDGPHTYEDGHCIRCDAPEECRPVEARTVSRGEIEAWTYDCQDWGDRDKVPSTIEITVGHYYTGMVPVYVRIRPREEDQE